MSCLFKSCITITLRRRSGKEVKEEGELDSNLKEEEEEEEEEVKAVIFLNLACLGQHSVFATMHVWYSTRGRGLWTRILTASVWST